MKLWSDSWTNGDRIPVRYAAGRPDGQGNVTFGDNLNPHLAWSDVPEGAKSLVLVCHDFDVPLDAAAVNRPDRELAADCERTDFFHWVLVDLPPRPTVIGEGEFSRGFVPRGKPGPDVPGGPARQGLNDYTRWFASDPRLAGSYFGYDGPFPPWNDSLVHHYVFTLYAVALARLPLEGVFDGHAVRRALAGRVLAEATFSGTYSLNPRLHADV
ncbi:MAG: YbhB/YbcL family Raf kinase inhibitor-like protein [Pseudomonadota bacterium]|jgi:Raf kinase inhibitor-like YbhB/YbcL family protein|nr:YbhB/YbcL family Raf kinase inhibitor-like protein [Rubrivivax sp.]MCA3258949.1 YbhB/YbcL family Raf kinase inhibitor-like protein [Rubrivivax sp.]MCE2913912.1 YbhB/YbcL family Raf kinase inhibitor-like protein [Rubrivivax sp.]MCZ8032123.1 YbhB/YbcL family Raf kinase inhibitor-like protein [Rubrivivax sp.]